MKKLKKILSVAASVLSLASAAGCMFIGMKLCPVMLIYGVRADYRSSLLKIAAAMIVSAVCLVLVSDYKKTKPALFILCAASLVPVICSFVYVRGSTISAFICYSLMTVGSASAAAFSLFGLTPERQGGPAVDIILAAFLLPVSSAVVFSFVRYGSVGVGSLLLMLFLLPAAAVFSAFILMRDVRKKRGAVRITVSVLSLLLPALTAVFLTLIPEAMIIAFAAAVGISAVAEIVLAIVYHKRKNKTPATTETEECSEDVQWTES